MEKVNEFTVEESSDKKLILNRTLEKKEITTCFEYLKGVSFKGKKINVEFFSPEEEELLSGEEEFSEEEEEDKQTASICIEKPDLDVILDLEKIVIKKKEIPVIFNYPLANPTVFKLEANVPKGFTRGFLISEVCRIYQRIYDEEDQDEGKETENITGMLNRKKSKGRYGIWGHGIGDLALVSVVQIKDNIFGLNVDS